jgi:cell division protein FtsQ
LFLPGIVVFSFFHLDNKGFFNLGNIDIDFFAVAEAENYWAPYRQELLNKLEAQKQQSLWKVDLDLWKKELLNQPWIQEVELRKVWPDQLRVRLRTKEIEAILLLRNGDFVPLTSEGAMLNPASVKTIPDVPLLVGRSLEANQNLRTRALDLLKNLPDQSPFSKQSISEISFDEKDGFWVQLIEQGTRVRLGKDQLDRKSQRVNQVLSYLQTNTLQARVIDADLSKKVVVRLRKDP